MLDFPCLLKFCIQFSMKGLLVVEDKHLQLMSWTVFENKIYWWSKLCDDAVISTLNNFVNRLNFTRINCLPTQTWYTDQNIQNIFGNFFMQGTILVNVYSSCNQNLHYIGCWVMLGIMESCSFVPLDFASDQWPDLLPKCLMKMFVWVEAYMMLNLKSMNVLKSLKL